MTNQEIKTEHEKLKWQFNREFGLEFDDNNIVTNLGKFENMPLVTVYYYNAFMNGGADNFDDDYEYFDISDFEREVFGLTGKQYALRISDDGFVYGHCQ